MRQVLVAVPGEEVMIKQIGEGTHPISDIVGGSLECVQLGNDFVLYCNEESTNMDLPINPHFAQGIVKGTFVIAKRGQDGKNMALDEKEIQFLMKTFIRTQ